VTILIVVIIIVLVRGFAAGFHVVAAAPEQHEAVRERVLAVPLVPVADFSALLAAPDGDPHGAARRGHLVWAVPLALEADFAAALAKQLEAV
jgi:hypothetical protein